MNSRSEVLEPFGGLEEIFGSSPSGSGHGPQKHQRKPENRFGPHERSIGAKSGNHRPSETIPNLQNFRVIGKLQILHFFGGSFGVLEPLHELAEIKQGRLIFVVIMNGVVGIIEKPPQSEILLSVHLKQIAPKNNHYITPYLAKLEQHLVMFCQTAEAKQHPRGQRQGRNHNQIKHRRPLLSFRYALFRCAWFSRPGRRTEMVTQ
jgi:hypothetical protein